ncbi:MAG: response regulator transcription factor [Deltaproteobacteria bacterium]|nr:response regulator transcription factor [Deltaproteobacteria bacterium]
MTRSKGTQILVVDDHEVVRAGICRLLDAEPDLTVVADTGSGHEAVGLCRKVEPDVVVLDYSLPDLDGLEVTSQIVALDGRTRILVLTMHANEEYATRVIQAGAAGFVAKVAPADELLVAVRKVAGGGVYVSPEIMDKMVSRLGQPVAEVPEMALSNRELQVLTRLARGMKTREVAEALYLSASTVETYRGRILEKLNLRNNSDVTRFAIRRGLVELD